MTEIYIELADPGDLCKVRGALERHPGIKDVLPHDLGYGGTLVSMLVIDPDIVDPKQEVMALLQGIGVSASVLDEDF